MKAWALLAQRCDVNGCKKCNERIVDIAMTKEELQMDYGWRDNAEFVPCEVILTPRTKRGKKCRS